jgi:D-alanyl-D-alanine carboxypeptidase (penicillin-binding protein 5/6)
MKLIQTFITLLLCVFAANISFAYETKADYAILMDYETGNVLFQKNADEQMTPSSMSKLMTIYILLERIKKDVLKLDDTFVVSKKAWKMGGSKMFLRHTERVTIDDLLKGIIVQSGNDACVVVAEGIAATEESFANLMNETAKELGLKNSNFVNSTGWPAENHYMSAADIATLSRSIISEFPEYYKYSLAE